jgi:hypothetical protein
LALQLGSQTGLQYDQFKADMQKAVQTGQNMPVISEQEERWGEGGGQGPRHKEAFSAG